MHKPIIRITQIMLLLLILLVGLTPIAVFATDPHGTVTVSTGSWAPNPAAVGDTITSAASASDRDPPLPKKEHTITPHWTWATAGVYVSSTGDSGTFTPYTGNYIITWNNDGDDTGPGIAFIGLFNDPGYYIVKIDVSVRYHDDTTNSDVRTASGIGYLGGVESDIAGASGHAITMRAHQLYSGGNSNKGIPVLNGFHYIAEPQLAETHFRYAPVNYQSSSMSDIKVFSGDIITFVFGPGNPDQDQRQPKDAPGNFGSSTYETVAGTGNYSIKGAVSGGGGNVVFPNGTVTQEFQVSSAQPTVSVKSDWDKTPFSVTLTFHDTGVLPNPTLDDGDPGDTDSANTWRFIRGFKVPTKLTQVSTTPLAGQYAQSPATYTYLAGTAAPPTYSGVSVEETFANPIPGFSSSDVTSEFKAKNPALANNLDMLALEIFGTGNGGTTSSFVIDNTNKFSDKHGGNNFVSGIYNKQNPMIFTTSALANGIICSQPQTYICGGHTIGSCVITRKLIGQFQLTTPNDQATDGEGTYTAGTVLVSKTAP